MKPTQEKLCQALIVIGSEYRADSGVRKETICRLAELGLIQWDGEWELTDAGAKLLPKLQDGAAPQLF
jgi:hypothetical protein